MSNEKQYIYFDNSASSPIEPSIIPKMNEIMQKFYANPSSAHLFAKEADEIVETARAKVAQFFNGKPEEIVFTASGSESDNLAIIGYALSKDNHKKHIITTTIEHKAVTNSCKFLQDYHGFSVTYIKPQHNGSILASDVEKAITNDTALISVMYANNETGAIQPIEEIAKIAQKHNIKVHTDAVQVAGKLVMDVQKLGVDMISISGHKLHAPKGIGVLWVKEELRSKLRPVVFGGGHEFGLRSGTVATHQIYAMGEICGMYTPEYIAKTVEYVKNIRDTFESKLTSNISDIVINAKDGNRVCNVSSVTFKYIDAEALFTYLYDICCTSGSACSEALDELSPVLQTMGIADVDIRGTIRYSFSKFNTIDEVNDATDRIIKVVSRLREMSPIANKK